MIKMKKIFSFLLSASIALSSIASVSALDYGSEWSGHTSSAVKTFTDVPEDHWAKKNIDRAVKSGWFDGYEDGSFHPNDTIKRSEAMTVFVKFLGLSPKKVETSSYHDVETSAWYSPYIEAGKKLFPEIAAFDGTVSFQPEQPMKREDTTYALVIALKYNDKIVNVDQSNLNMFKDQNSISAQVKPYVSVAVKYGLVSGYEDGTFDAQGSLTRAEFATMLARGTTIGYGTGGGLADVPEQPAPTPTAAPATQQPSTPAPTATAPSASAVIEGRVVDADNNPVSGANISLSDGASAVTDANGQYSVTAVSQSVTITASKEGYVNAQTTMSVTMNITNYAETLKLVRAAQGTIAGKVYDAVVQNGIVEGADIKFRKNGNTTSGEVVATASSDSNGSYSVSLPTGTYTAECSKSGYSTAFVTVVSQEAAAQQDITLAPEMEGTAFILTWGENPADIDSHLTGPLSNGSRFHVYYRRMNAVDESNTVANLDRDDVTSYGPETVTLLQQRDGVYRYTVHDYSNRYATDSKALSLSGAKVTVYVDGVYKNTFNVPTNVGGTIWSVFELNGTEITPINTMSYESDPSAVSASNSGTLSDVDIISATISEK